LNEKHTRNIRQTYDKHTTNIRETYESYGSFQDYPGCIFQWGSIFQVYFSNLYPCL